MKYRLLILLFLPFLLKTQIVFERIPYGNIWLLGGRQIRLDFNNSPVSITSEQREIRFSFTNASTCNKAGELEFYTNGIRVANKNHTYLENGYRINPGDYSDDWENIGNRIIQGALILPEPESDSIYHLIYAEKEYLEIEGQTGGMVSKLHHGLIDMEANDELGLVLEKDFPLILDTLDGGKITACRHGNGRDWWIVVPYFNANEYHRFLLDNEGLHDYGLVNAGEGMKWGLGQAVFSPDGTKYVNYSLHMFEENYVGIYDFDRCTGELIERVIIPNDLFLFAGGVAISENGRFLYESSYFDLFQIDLEADDISASRTKIAEYDGYWEEIEDLKTTFFMAQITPDGRIFINSPNSATKLHSIESPNKRGIASDFQQHSISLPAWNQLTLPNFPYYGLGPLDGSPCDTLNINNPTPEAAFEYTPDSLEQTVEFFDASHYAYEWLWDFGDGSELDTLHHPVHTYAEAGSYEVCLTVTNVTGSDTYCETIQVGTTDSEYIFSSDATVTIAPNPIENQAILSLEGFEKFQYEPLRFSIKDVNGRVVFKQILTTAQSEFELDVRQLPSGFYAYQISTEDSFLLAVGKMIKI